MNTFNSYQCGRNCKYFDLFSLIYWKTTSCFTLMKELKVVETEKNYINVTVGNNFITELAKKTSLPLDPIHCQKGD